VLSLQAVTDSIIDTAKIAASVLFIEKNPFILAKFNLDYGGI